MKYIALICLSLASAASADLNVDTNQSSESQNASSAALDAAGNARQFGINNMSEGSFEEFTGANTDSTANFGGSSTNMGLSQIIEFNLSCVEDASKYAGGYMFYSSGCSVTGTSVISHNIRWCYLKDGIRCFDEGNLRIGSGDIASIQGNELTSVSCSESSCNYSFASSQSSSFDGSNLEQEGVDLDDAEGSFVFDSIEEITSNPDLGYASAENEAAGLQGYIDGSYDDLTESGEMPIYRNSEDDIARYGVRVGNIAVPFASEDESTVCDSVDLTQLESCDSTYPVVEYTCEPPVDLSCHYKREVQMETCSRRRIVSCDSFNACTSDTDFADNGAIRNFGVGNIERGVFSSNYQGFSLTTCDNNCLDRGYYHGYISFDITDLSKVQSFVLSRIHVDDFLGLRVNGNFVFAAWSDADKTSQNKYPIDFDLDTTRWTRAAIIFSDGSESTDDKGSTRLTPNMNLKNYLVEGNNIIHFDLGVLGSGELNLYFNYSGLCSCNTSEYWEETCNAVF